MTQDSSPHTPLMWRSGLFWRLFATCGIVWLVAVALIVTLHETIADRLWLFGSGAAIAGLGALGIAFWLTRRIAHPLQELTQAAESIAEGGFGQKVYASTKDEVGTLARAFNQMSERLAVQFARMDEDRQQLRTILSGMVEGVIALDAGQRILFANDARAIAKRERGGRGNSGIIRVHASETSAWRGRPRPTSNDQQPDGALLTVHAALAGRRASSTRAARRSDCGIRRAAKFVTNVSHELKTRCRHQACVETLLDGAPTTPPIGFVSQQISDRANDCAHPSIVELGAN